MPGDARRGAVHGHGRPGGRQTGDVDHPRDDPLDVLVKLVRGVGGGVAIVGLRQAVADGVIGVAILAAGQDRGTAAELGHLGVSSDRGFIYSESLRLKK